MYEETYLPAAWYGENHPAPRTSPVDFVVQDGEGWVLREAGQMDIPLGDGNVVDFMVRHGFGPATLIVDSVGAFTTDRPVQPKLNCFNAGEVHYETLLDAAAGLGVGEHLIDTYWWAGPITLDVSVGAEVRIRLQE